MRNLTALLSGLLFGFGLIISGMANPAKVSGFLDITGRWDPSLAFVMIGAIGVGLMSFGIMKKRRLSALGEPVQIPTSSRIDRPLLVGSALFGIGWGLAGICPGPALVLAGGGLYAGIIFTLAMLVGMWLFSAVQRR